MSGRYGRATSPPRAILSFGEPSFQQVAAESTMPEPVKPETDILTKALRAQADEEAHDRGLIVERLGWTPDQRLEANASIVRFYLSVRPEGPLIRE